MWLRWLFACVLANCGMVVVTGETVEVTSYSCGGSAHEVDSSIKLKYTGGSLSRDPCEYEFKAEDWDKKLCVEPVHFKLPCNIKVKYNSGYYSSTFPDKEYDCYSKQYSKWCTISGTLHIGFEKDTGSSSSTTNFEVKITAEEDSFSSEIVSKTISAMVIIGIVIAVIIVVVVVAVIVVCCVCNKRQSRSAGTVYRSPQQAAATTGPYTAQPMGVYPQQAGYPPQQPGYPPQQPGYPPQQPGYQHPQPGYQPPPQGYQPGYQPPAQGYPSGPQPPPQYQAAGNQGQAPPMTEKPPIAASAPPAGDNTMPPPYPGN